jgi:predicted permease
MIAALAMGGCGAGTNSSKTAEPSPASGALDGPIDLTLGPVPPGTGPEQPTGERGWLGIELAAVAPGEPGVSVRAVVPGSPAAKAGLSAGDVILSIGGQSVGEPREVVRLVAEHGAGRRLSIAFSRGATQLTFGISPELNGYTPAQSRVLFGRVEEEMAALPGVTSVSSALVPLLSGSNWGSDVSVEGFKKGPDTDANARFNETGTGYLHTTGIGLLSGREFTPADNLGAPKVAIVNETFAKKFALGRDAVGKRMSTGGNTLDIEIVGLMKDAKYSEVKQVIPPLFFVPYRQDSTLGFINFYVRTAREPSSLLRAIPGVMAKLDPNLPVENLKTVPQQVRDNVFLDRMISTLSMAFAALATLLAAVGLYGVLAYSVAQRTREIGVRMALGADARRVQGMILRQVGMMTLIGGIIGLGGALALGKGASSLLFGLQPRDPAVMALSALVLTAVALGAGFVPALRASRTDPMHALRYQ